ncbi:MAG: C4-dicarboxylate ABC transporter substrate-binding protein, partial [Candidatus Competibacteraceae bacterium]|nr:C4-dicarboxylate ABC transporter substrate-binding protein [Candidatus Competibacteraceae bacterium]
QSTYNKYLETVLAEEFIKAGGTIYAPTAEEKESFRAAKPVIKDWFVQNIEDGQLWYDKLEAAVQQAEAEVDAERAEVAN